MVIPLFRGHTGERKVVAIPGQMLESDDVYYSTEAGVLVARVPRSSPRPHHLYNLAPNVAVEVDEAGLPVMIEVVRSKEYWAQRSKLEKIEDIRLGRVHFYGPLDYDYWTNPSAVVVCDIRGSSSIVEFYEDLPPIQGIQLSPRVIFFLTKAQSPSSILLRDFDNR